MRNLFILLTVLMLPFSLFAQGWQWIYPYPTTNRVIDFYFTDKDNGFILAENGEILATNDGCVTWKSTTMEDMTLVDIFGFDENSAWILARERGSWSSTCVLLKTIDGGITWSKHDLSSRSLECLFFISETKGWVAGAYGDIKMTNNGGVSWTDKSIEGDYNPDIFFIHFTDDQNGILLAQDNGIICGRTTNGGSSWDLNFAGVENYFGGGCCKGTDFYYAVGENGLILGTENYGENWALPSNNLQNNLYSIAFSDNSTGWAVGEDSTILKTTDGGASWKSQTMPFSSDFIEVRFTDNNVGMVLGVQNGDRTSQTFLCTEDGGHQWENKFLSFDENLYFTDVCFIDSLNGWLISEKKIFHTKDGGRNWESQYNAVTGWSSSEYLYSILFVDSLNGFCVGSKSNNGFILKTTDGGENWISSSYAFGGLRDLHFVSDKTGWFVGNDGTILRTTNGGATFEFLSSNITNDICDVYFLDENCGWAVSTAQTVLLTKDGGINWISSTFSSSYYDDGRCVFFKDSLTGFIGTSDGLFKSIDGGVNWSSISLTGYDYITDIHFVNDKEGWALASYSGWSGSGGVVYHTTDGGITWNVALNSGEDFNAFSFIPQGYAWAVGGNSTIAKYTHSESWTSVSLSKPTFEPADYKLHQCYPNPFNPSTTIMYELPEQAHVELKVFDMLGREVKTLVNTIEDAGRHQVRLDLRNYSSGTYFYRIKSNNFVKTKKLTLVK